MRYQWADHHVFRTGEGGILFGVEQGSLFRITAGLRESLLRWGGEPVVDLAALPSDERELLEPLPGMGILVPPGKAPSPAGAPAADPPLTTLVLEVAQACNLDCRYCYAEGGGYGGEPALLDPETARRAVRYLFERSAGAEMITLILFGGEPLLNLEGMRAAIDEVRIREQETGQKVLVALTTNGTLLDPEIIAYLHRHRVSVSVSLDGPPDLHDANRPGRGGEGSYHRIVPHLKRLLEGSPRPVGVRVTLTPEQWCRVEEVFDHLRGLGFHEVGIAPASPVRPEFLPDTAREEELLRSFAALGDRFLIAARQGELIPFTNLIDLLARLHAGQVKSVSCGAGFGYLAVDVRGSLFLCHRLVGEESFRVGDLDSGATRPAIDAALEGVTAGKAICSSCWARTLCAGGCHYENDLRQRRLGLPPGSSCSFIRKWLQLGIEIYAQLKEAQEPRFLSMLEKRARC